MLHPAALKHLKGLFAKNRQPERTWWFRLGREDPLAPVEPSREEVLEAVEEAVGRFAEPHRTEDGVFTVAGFQTAMGARGYRQDLASVFRWLHGVGSEVVQVGQSHFRYRG